MIDPKELMHVTDRDWDKNLWQEMLEVTQDRQAASIMYLATILHSRLKHFDHQICMGIRHGLEGFDTGASEIIEKLEAIRSEMPQP